jgi:hypothetical protein
VPFLNSAPEVSAIWTLRCYLFEDSGVIKRIPRRVQEGLVSGEDALLEYANSVQRVADVVIENDSGNPIKILEAIGSYWTFDADGKIHKALRKAGAEVMDLAFFRPQPVGAKVISLTPALKRQAFQKEHKWEVGKAQLDWIAADIWPTGNDAGVKISIAKGTAPKTPPLTREAENALRQIDGEIAVIKSRLDRLSEAALKGLAFAARQRVEFPDDLWSGLATDCDHCREIKSRHRTGRGIWFAVIEACQSHPGSNIPYVDVDEIAFKKCNGRKAAAEAARQMLKENAESFNESTSIEARLYCELEWEPPEDHE